MSEPGFLRRWARRKTEVREGRALVPEPAAEPSPAPHAGMPVDDAVQPQAVAAPPAPQPATDATDAAPRLPTMADVATLDRDSDFSAFVARGVDQAVRRGALKKLFADPHFNVMDGLDIYIDDYNKASPMSETMLASLEHAKSVFMKMVDDAPASEQATGQEPEQAPPLKQPPEQETQ